MKRFQIFLVTIFIILGLIIFHWLGYLKFSEDIVLKAISPFGKIVVKSSSSLQSFWGKFVNLKDLQKENSELKKRLDEKEKELVDLYRAKEENESLKRDLEFKLNSGFTTISADVVMYDPSGARQTVIIDKGEEDGVGKNMAVVSEGFLVGRVQETKQKTAKVILLTDPTSAVPVYIQNSTTTGIVKGQIGYGLQIEKVPQGDTLKQGQIVVSSGLGGDFPKGIMIGKIDKIEKSDNEIFQKASVRPQVNFRMLERVMVIRK